MRAILAGLALALALPVAAHADEGAFHLAEHERIYATASVQLPRYMWFLADFNRDIRVAGFEVELVMTCASEAVSRRRHEVTCLIDDAALRASPLRAEQGRAGKVLEQMRDKLDGATVVLQVRDNGLIKNVALRDAYRRGQRHRRIRQMNENLRLVVMRALAGLDLERPRKGYTEDEVWAQGDTLLTMAPSAVGTMGSTQIVHKSRALEDDLLPVTTAGKAMIAPATSTRGGAPADTFDTRIEAEALVDPQTGGISSRAWKVIGTPTPSSAIAEGPAGLPYVQQGRVVALRDGDEIELGATGEVENPGKEPSAIQVGESLGVPR